MSGYSTMYEGKLTVGELTAELDGLPKNTVVCVPSLNRAPGEFINADHVYVDLRDNTVCIDGDVAEASKYARMVSLLVRLKDTVEALDGTSVENESLVDEYRRVMLQLGS